MSEDGSSIAVQLSTPESGSQIALLDAKASPGRLLSSARLISPPDASERLSVPHFAASVLYATAFTWNPGQPFKAPRLLTIDPQDLSISPAVIKPPANWTSFILDPTSQYMAWTEDGRQGLVFIARVGDSANRRLVAAASVLQIGW